jgi:hypothetical protein
MRSACKFHSSVVNRVVGYSCIPSKNRMAKLFGILGASLYAFVSLGTVVGIIIYLAVFVPWFNLTPQYYQYYGLNDQ